MNWLQSPLTVEVDLTSYCNAACPSCRRTYNIDDMQLHHFDVDVWKNMLNNLDGIIIDKFVFNGNWGDSFMHKDILEIIDSIAEYDRYARIYIDTNGGMRKPEFWASAAKLFKEKLFYPVVVRFGIDGIDNFSNDVYRVDVEYDKVLENALAFNNAGGVSQWNMTVFDHNVTYLWEAVEIADEYKFSMFRSRPSYSRQVQDKHKNIKATTYCYETHKKEDIFFNKKLSNGLNTHTILYPAQHKLKSKCYWQAQQKVQIDPWANVWPCCHISGETLDYDKSSDEYIMNVFEDTWQKYGYKCNNLEKHTLKEILTSKYFANDVDETIENNPWAACSRYCGV